MKKLLAVFLSLAMIFAMAACSGNSENMQQGSSAEGLDPNIKATLTFGTWDADAMRLYDELDIEGRFQQLYHPLISFGGWSRRFDKRLRQFIIFRNAIRIFPRVVEQDSHRWFSIPACTTKFLVVMDR